MFFDEVDLCFRIKKAGWKIFYAPSAEMIHHGGSSIKKWGALNLGKHWTRSRNFYFRKHYGDGSVHILYLFDLLRALLLVLLFLSMIFALTRLLFI